MLELDHVWSKMLDEAADNASKSGRQSVVDYLRLRATNDAIRRAGVKWLFDTLIEIASEASVTRPTIVITHDEPHNFAYGNSNMVGSRLEIRLGVRCLTVEAGWARSPKDGIMREGALAFARITHFGMRKHLAEYRLVHAESLPSWLDDANEPIGSHAISRHFDIFLER